MKNLSRTIAFSFITPKQNNLETPHGCSCSSISSKPEQVTILLVANSGKNAHRRGFASNVQRLPRCFQLFDDMVVDGNHPNEVLFVAILSACSHAGYVETGDEYFDQMVRHYGIKPSIEHYGCMVDLLGRAGRLTEAEELIMSLPEKPNSVIWGAFLGACRMHSDVTRGNLAFKHLTELEPMSGDRYKLAGIMFANAGEKENATKIRKIITENDLETTRGLSFIEIDGEVHEFVAGTINHSRHKEIYKMWDRVNRLLEIHELDPCIQLWLTNKNNIKSAFDDHYLVIHAMSLSLCAACGNWENSNPLSNIQTILIQNYTRQSLMIQFIR